MRRLSIFLILFALVAGLLPAQTPTGTIQGTITDATGGVVPGAKVVITHVDTNTAITLTTDDTGRYVRPLLRPGSYTITVEKAGFQTLHQGNVTLDVSQNRSVDLMLQAGAITQEVRVEATPPPVDVSTSSIGQVIENKRVMDLPLNGRSVFNLANLTPGVNPTGGGATPGMGGGRNAMSDVQIDGMTDIAPENNVGINNRIFDPQVDAVQEFSVQVNSLAAEYGRFAGGVINVVTKGGTNQIHGTAYDYVRNPWFNANGFINNKYLRPRSGSKQNQYGFTVGGPVYIPHVFDGRNKSFFFADLENSPTRGAFNVQLTMPLDEWKAGNFSNLKTSSGTPIIIYDPKTVRQDPNNPTKYIRDPFGSNIIPTNRIDPVAANMAKYYPSPNFPAQNPYTQLNNFVNSGPNTSNGHRNDTRWDQYWTEKWRMFARVSFSWGDSSSYNGFGTAGTSSGDGPSTSFSSQVSIDQTYTVSPTIIANLRYGFSRFANTHVPFSDGIDLTKLGFSQTYAQTAAMRGLEFPNVGLSSNLSIAGLGQAGWTRLFQYPMNHSLTASVSKMTPRHMIKAGGEYRKLLINFAQYGYPSGSYTVDRGWTQQEINTASSTQGTGLSSFLLGLGNGGYMTHEPSASSASSYYALYVQDDWKLTSRLTINLGLRYDVDVPRTERYNQYSFWVPTDVSPMQGKVPASACGNCGDLRGAMHFVTPDNRRQTPTDKNDFGPRVGFAYNFAKTMVLRGAYGISYAPSGMQAAGTSGTAGMEGFQTNSNVAFTYDTMRTIYTTLSNPYPAGFNMPTGNKLGASTNLGLSVGDSFFDAYRTPYVQQWNMNLQRSLPGNLVAEVGYMGNHTLHLIDGETGLQYNQLPASYMALGTQLQQQVNNPFYGLIPYTTGSLAQPTVAYSQLLKRFPEYSGVQSYRKPNASSIYHAMTLRVDKRFSHGMSVLFSYTGGKLIDDASSAVNFIGTIAGTHLDFYNRKLERSISSFDVSQRAVISYVYELPFGKGKSLAKDLPKAVDLLVSGWQVNGITTFQTGLTIIISGVSNNTNIGTSSQRALSNGHTAYIDHSGQTMDQQMAKWFDPSVFSQPVAFTFGNVGRTLPDVRAPGTNSTDLSLFKNTYFGKEQRLTFQLRAEAFSAFNHFNPGGPNASISSGSTGIITGGGGTRTIQLAAKLLW
ncbi:MAG: carboxypeptidase-like regulatory domain-containing protein [Acidobacteriia bacterium]|nr:carboxypeptidase-like regulatory domain-containing protein [Terriglobia bacterium]